MCVSSFFTILLCLVLPSIIQRRQIDFGYVAVGMALVWGGSCFGTLGFIIGLVVFYTYGGRITANLRRYFR